MQFAFVKVKDLNTALPKLVLIGWCGEGVPERTKGYFTSHQAAVVKVLHVRLSPNSLAHCHLSLRPRAIMSRSPLGPTVTCLQRELYRKLLMPPAQNIPRGPRSRTRNLFTRLHRDLLSYPRRAALEDPHSTPCPSQPALALISKGRWMRTVGVRMPRQ